MLTVRIFLFHVFDEIVMVSVLISLMSTAPLPPMMMVLNDTLMMTLNMKILQDIKVNSNDRNKMCDWVMFVNYMDLCTMSKMTRIMMRFEILVEYFSTSTLNTVVGGDRENCCLVLCLSRRDEEIKLENNTKVFLLFFFI